MKFLLVFFLAFPLFAQAQDALENRCSFGFKNGVVRSTLKRNIYHNGTRGVTGATIGFLFKYALNKKWALQSELSYSNRGYKQSSGIYFPSSFSSPVAAGNVSYLNKYSYLEIPVLLNYNLINKKLILGLQTGPGFNFFLFGKSHVESSSLGINSSDRIFANFINVDMLAGVYAGIKMADRFKVLLNPRVGICVSNSTLSSFKYFELSYAVSYEF